MAKEFCNMTLSLTPVPAGSVNYCNVIHDVNTIRQCYRYGIPNTHHNHTMASPFTIGEISQSARKMQCRTAAGPGDIPAMLI